MQCACLGIISERVVLHFRFLTASSSCNLLCIGGSDAYNDLHFYQ